MPGCILCGNPDTPGVQKPQNSCQLSHGHPCTPCRQMKELEAQIFETKNALENLVARHRELQSEANHSHIPIVLRVPEIASTIFQLCLPDDLAEITSSTDRSQLAAPLTLGAVCRSWRQIACSTPRLWSCISIDLDPLKFPARSEQVQQWLARSGQLPLSIHVGTDDNDLPYYRTAIFNHLFDIINKYSSRWYYLNLDIPAFMISQFVGDSQGVSILRTLRLHEGDHSQFQSEGQFSLAAGKAAPINVMFCDFRLQAVDIIWNNVTHVEVTSLHLDECIELIWRTSSLIKCKIGDVLPQENHFTIPNHPVIIPQLQLLNFGAYQPQVDLFFDRITLPSLQHFGLDTMGGEALPSESLGSLFRRSCCSLRHLELDETSFDDIQVNELLRTTSSLRTLKVDFWPDEYEPDSLFRLLATTSMISQDDQHPRDLFLPELQSIEFIISPASPNPLSWELVSAICGPLSEINKPHRRPLQELKIVLDHHEDYPWIPHIDKETIPRFLDLVDAGISLRLTLRISDGDQDLLQLSMEHHGITKENYRSSSSESSIQS